VNAWLQKIVGSGNRDTAIRPTLLDLESIPCDRPFDRRPFSAITRDGLELHPAVEKICFAAAELLRDSREARADSAEIHFDSGQIHADEPELRSDIREHHFDVSETRADVVEIPADSPAQASDCA